MFFDSWALFILRKNKKQYMAKNEHQRKILAEKSQPYGPIHRGRRYTVKKRGYQSSSLVFCHKSGEKINNHHRNYAAYPYEIPYKIIKRYVVSIKEPIQKSYNIFHKNRCFTEYVYPLRILNLIRNLWYLLASGNQLCKIIVKGVYIDKWHKAA